MFLSMTAAIQTNVQNKKKNPEVQILGRKYLWTELFLIKYILHVYRGSWLFTKIFYSYVPSIILNRIQIFQLGKMPSLPYSIYQWSFST